jgi:UDP-N-acetylmuramoyl-L-alanyl-D-glutamate--2,6-diaminopimelate ligase
MLANTATQLPLSILLGDWVGEEAAGLQASGLELDSRKLGAGDLFVALPGDMHDGRDYLAQAAAANAVAIAAEPGVSPEQRAAAGPVPVIEVPGLGQGLGDIASRFYGNPSAEMHVVGITGTNGKTTTSRLVAQLLRSHFGDCGVIGTLGSTLGDDVSEAANTTPDAISVHRQLASWRDAGVACAALEVSSHSLVQGRVSAVEFDSAVFTNLSHDHLDYHGDMESYGLAKSRLFRDSKLRAAIINADDPYSEQIGAAVHKSVPVITYSARGAAARLAAWDVKFLDPGLEAQVITPWGDGVLRSPLAADFNLSNLLAAIACACVAGMPLDHALDCAARLQGVPGRMEYVANDWGLQLVVDYAHTPDALQQALTALRAHTRGRLICVFGCGGDRDAAKRAVMGEVATRLSDEVIVTSDNPRNEDPLSIIAEIQAGCGSNITVEPDRARAIASGVELAQPGDCLLVAGKGHEAYQQVGSERLDFSDVEQIRSALAGRTLH